MVGEVGDEKKEFLFRREFPREDQGTREVAETWGRRKSFHLLSRICEEGPRDEWLAEIDALARRFKIRNPYGRTASLRKTRDK